MAIFNRNQVKLNKKSVIGQPDPMLDQMVGNIAKSQIMSQGGRVPDTGLNRTPYNNNNVITPARPNNTVIPDSAVPQSGPIKTIQDAANRQADADRVNAVRGGIRQTGQVPAGPRGTPPTGPRVGSTPFSGITNQSDLVKNFDFGGPANLVDRTPKEPEQSRADRLLEEQIARLEEAGRGDEAQRAKARADAAKSFDVQNAFAIESARAKSGAFGAGMLGAGQALESQTAREGAREKSITLDELDRRAREEAIKAAMGITDIVGRQEGIKSDRDKLDLERKRLETDTRLSEQELAIKRESAAREAAAFDMTIDEFEREFGEDRDGDGLIAGQTKEQFKAKEEEDKAEAERQSNPETQDLDPTTERRLKAFAARYDNDLGAMPPWEQDAVRRAGGVEKWARQEAARQGKSVAQFLTEWQDNIINTGIVNLNRGWSKI